MVVDSRFREDDQRLRRFFADLTRDGTPYMQLPRIIEGLFLAPSQYSIGLQCADLIVAMTANAERGPGQGRGYLKKLLPRFARHPATGDLDGVGLKRFPEQVPRANTVGTACSKGPVPRRPTLMTTSATARASSSRSTAGVATAAAIAFASSDEKLSRCVGHVAGDPAARPSARILPRRARGRTWRQARQRWP